MSTWPSITDAALLSSIGNVISRPSRQAANSGLWRNSCKERTAWRSALLGIVAQCTQPPPTSLYFSTTATRLPALAARIAAPSPPGPLPSTMTSNS